MCDVLAFVQCFRLKPVIAGLGAVLSLAAPGPVSKAETLKEALTAAYLFNPTLKAARAQLRSADNGVALAKSGYRPRINAVSTEGYEDTKNKYSGPSNLVNNPLFTGSGTYNPRGAQLVLQQNVFDGFRTYNAVKEAEAAVEAGREDLRAAEQTVLLNAATAYVNVFRDQAIVQLRQATVRELAKHLTATERRFESREISRTDVYQAQTALASAEADLSIAQGTLYSNQALFAQYIGHPPATLREPAPATRLIPPALDSAVGIAKSENPAVLAAIFRERAQEHVVKEVKSQLLPSLTLNASYTDSAQASNPYLRQTEDARVLGTLTVPLYEGGSVSAQIRGAVETVSQRREQIDEARKFARQQVSSAWGLYLAAKGNIAAGNKATEFVRLALTGIREEEKLGQRTLGEVLGAEQANLTARVNLVSYRHDLVVASYSVLTGMGRLDASAIAVEAELYDATRNYDEVKDAWYGLGASIEDRQAPRVAPVANSGRAVGQNPDNGPAYTQGLFELKWSESEWTSLFGN